MVEGIWTGDAEMSMARVNFPSHQRLARDKDHLGFGRAIWVSTGCETEFADSLKKKVILLNKQGLIALFFTQIHKQTIILQFT
jgi:hypothetical protein